VSVEDQAPEAPLATAEQLAVLARLEGVIRSRRGADPESSHTARMLARGTRKCAQKFGEEAVETVVAAVAESRADLASEAADALYHLLIVLASRDVALSDVLAQLAKREGKSGVAEKAARTVEGARSDAAGGAAETP
jgi:phosphoribosyl-ATP pyrophosphohydrolase